MLKNLLAFVVVSCFLISSGAQACGLPCEAANSSVGVSSTHEDTTPSKAPLDNCEHCSLSHHHHSDSGSMPVATLDDAAENYTAHLVAWNDRFYFSIGIEPSLEPPSHI